MGVETPPFFFPLNVDGQLIWNTILVNFDHFTYN
jgi:hypothetical protein